MIKTETTRQNTTILALKIMGAESVVGQEISKHASISIHAPFRQRLYMIVMHKDENHSLIQWIMAPCRITWPNKSNVPINAGQ